jgi:hypothetical protein
MAILDGDSDYLIEVEERDPCESDIENSNEDDEAAPRLGPTGDQLAVVVVPPPGVALQHEVAAAAFDGDADDDEEAPFADFALDGGHPRSPPPLPPPVASTAASSNESHGHAQPQRLPRIATGDRTSQSIIASALGPLYGVVPAVRIYFEGRCGTHWQYIERHTYGSRSMLPGSATWVAGPSESDHHAAIVKLFNTHVAPLAPAAGAAAQPPLPPPPDSDDSDLGSDTYVSIASHELLSQGTSSSAQHSDSNNTSEGSLASG